MGVILPIAGPILEGPRGHNPYHQAQDLGDTDVGRFRDNAACRSDPTFTRASPGLAVATGNSLKILTNINLKKCDRKLTQIRSKIIPCLRP